MATRRPIVVAALLVSLFMAALEATVVSTAMPTVVGDLGGFQRYSWVFAAYLLASTVTVPLYGKLADLHGRKPVMLFGILVFIAGSGLCGAASSMNQLIFFRVVQGIGAGAMQPMSLTIIGDLFTFKERGKVQGLFGAVWGIAGLIGPLTGGLIVKYLSWHWVFLLNVPLGIVAAALIASSLHENVVRRPAKLDMAGALLLTVGVGALLMGTSGRGATMLWALPVALAALAVFVLVERRVSEPVLPMDLMTTRVMFVSSVEGALLGASMFAMVTFVPLYVQGVLGGTAVEAGSAITPMVVMWPVSSALAGWIQTRTGLRPLIRTGLFVAAVTGLFLGFEASSASVRVLQVAMGFFGVGMGLANTALLVAVQTSVRWGQRGVATGASMFFRTVGGALGVAIMGAVIVATLTADPSVPAGAADALLGPTHGRGLDPAILHGLEGSLRIGLARVFWIICGISIFAFAVSWFFPVVTPLPEEQLPAGASSVSR